VAREEGDTLAAPTGGELPEEVEEAVAPLMGRGVAVAGDEIGSLPPKEEALLSGGGIALRGDTGCGAEVVVGKEAATPVGKAPVVLLAPVPAAKEPGSVDEADEPDERAATAPMGEGTAAAAGLARPPTVAATEVPTTVDACGTRSGFGMAVPTDCWGALPALERA